MCATKQKTMAEQKKGVKNASAQTEAENNNASQVNGNTSAQGEQSTETTETPKGEGENTSAPVDETLVKLQEEATQAQLAVAKAMQENPSDFDGNMKLMLAANKAMGAIKEYKNGLAQKELEQKLALIRKEKEAKVDAFLSAYDAYKAHAATITGEQTPEQIEQTNAIYKAYTDLRTEIVDAVAGKKVLHLAPTAKGTEGVKRGQLSQEIEQKYIDYRAAGKTDPEARKQLIQDGYNDGTMGAVVRAYLVRIGEKQ